MNAYRVWQIKRGDEVSGPFPEKLVCQHLLIGRIRGDDLLSIDGHSWRPYLEHPELVAEIEHMLGLDADNEDPQWREERLHAALRHADERKQPDRRGEKNAAAKRVWQSRRGIEERRLMPETEEQRTYREVFAEVDSWLQRYRPRNGRMALLLLSVILLAGLAMYHLQAETPIDIGLHRTAGACDQPPARGVDWRGCDKSGYLLAGADLRNANLSGINFSGANLSYANLFGARLDHAQLQGCILYGAVWTDGRVCRAGSTGSCR